VAGFGMARLPLSTTTEIVYQQLYLKFNFV